ncbi:hypothetical protein B0H16DRAFT_1716625 [Mycena metata]|uniref:Uncharacterized protein n=1 Tax=Mycena metata TaxID=1033252 RepID=A0AAD7JPI3_9AGAR|nr:hypothetical protein B0H16DRAFT_1716625 [Mycena metata]
MFNTKALFTASFIAATMVAAALGKAQAVLYASDNCSGDDHSGTIGMSRGVCHSTYFTYSPSGGAGSAGYANSVAFYTDGADEQYGYYTDTNCQDETEASDGSTGCVGLASGVKSFMKTA